MSPIGVIDPTPGMVLWITGLSGAGKSTIGHMVWQALRGDANRKVEILR